MNEAELARKLHDEVFSREANEKPEEQEESEEEQQVEQEEQPEEEETPTEPEVEVPAGGEPEESAAEEEEPTSEPEEPEPEPEPEDEEQSFYAARYLNREETERGLRERELQIARQAAEIGALRRENETLAGQVNELQGQVGRSLYSQEEHDVVAQAIESLEEHPLGPAQFIDQQLFEHGNIGLALSICDAWEEHDPISARTVRRKLEQVQRDAEEIQRQQVEAEEPFDAHAAMQRTSGELREQFPDWLEHVPAMVALVEQRSDNDLMKAALHSPDDELRQIAMLSFYNEAKASDVSVSSARDQIKEDAKQKKASARKRATVSSGSASANGGQAPRGKKTDLFLESMRGELRRQGAYADQ